MDSTRLPKALWINVAKASSVSLQRMADDAVACVVVSGSCTVHRESDLSL